MPRAPSPDGRAPPATLTCHYAGTTAVLRSVRHDVGAFLDNWQASNDLKNRVTLAVSELAANAVQAAPEQDFSVTVRVNGDTVMMRVRSATTDGAPPPRRSWRTPHPTALRGRGLAIVSTIAERVDVVRTPTGGVQVTARFTVT